MLGHRAIPIGVSRNCLPATIATVYLTDMGFRKGFVMNMLAKKLTSIFMHSHTNEFKHLIGDTDSKNKCLFRKGAKGRTSYLLRERFGKSRS